MIIDCDSYTVIEGNFGGGDSAPAPYRPIEASDTLASKQSLRMLFAISEGIIQSIDQIYVNGTPISGFDATSQTQLGTTNQSVISGFNNIETPFSVNTVLTSGVFVTRAVSSGIIDAVRINLKLQALFQILDNGDRVGYNIDIDVQTRPVAGSGVWTSAGTITKAGKASSVYGWDTRVNKPAGATGAWEFRLSRTTANDNSKQSSIVSFDSYTEIQDKQLAYPGTALVGLTFTNSDQLGGRIPTISFDVHGIKIKVPSSAFYNAATKIYTGVWNGAFNPIYQYTDNPAWILYNILCASLSFVVNTKTYQRGLGISESLIDRFSFYELAKYCDEFIDDGKGGTESRFTLNNQFYVRESAPTLIAYILTLCDANLTTKNGLITVISDRPTSATKIVNNSDVINGEFSYQGSHVDERYTFVNVTFNDPDDKSNTRTISESASQTLIDRFGFNPIDLVLVGCTSEGQARRKAKWLLELPTQVCTYKVGLAGAYYNIGEVVNIYDTRFTNLNGQGKIVAATTTQITLDRQVVLAAETYTIMVYADDGFTILEKIINQSSTTTNIVTMSTPLTSAPAVNSVWVIKGNVLPRPFRVSKIDRDENEYLITATFYDSTKWSRIEGGIVVTPPTGIFTNVDEFVTEPVTNITFQESFFNDRGINGAGKIIVKWDWDLDLSEKFAPTFDVIWRRDNLPFISLPSRQIKEAEILDTTPGIYEVIIYAVNVRGIRSIGVKQTYSYRIGAALSSLIAPENFWVKDTVGTAYQTRNLALTWTYPVANDLATDSLLDYIVEIWTSDGLTKKASYVVKPNSSRGGEFNYVLEQNVADFGVATRSVQVKVYSRDLIGDVSVAVSKTFTNPVPAVVSFTLLSGVGSTYINITTPPESDTAGYIIYRSTSSGFTPGSANLLYDGPDTYIALQGTNATTYYYRVAAYDTFAKTGLNNSSEQSSTTLSFDATQWSKTGINFTPNSPVTNSVAWTSGTALKNATTSYSIVAGNAAWTTGTLYIYFNPTVSTTVLQTTTSLATAVQSGNYPLATYQGGTNLKGGDGSAFISGSQIIAGTVGASELFAGGAIITGTAQIANSIITNAQIANATIDYGKISDTLQSTNFSTIAHTGWRINKTGGITVHDLTVLDSTGATVLASGSKVDFGNLIGATKPENNATVGGTFAGYVLSSLTFNGNAQVLSADSIRKNGGVNGWDTQGYSTQSFTGKGFFRFKFLHIGINAMAALNSDPTTDASYASLDYAIHGALGLIEIYESGTLVLSTGQSYMVTDIFDIKYEGTTISYIKNGIVFKTTTTTAGRTFFFDSSIYSPNTGFYDMQLYIGALGNISGQIDGGNVSTYIANAAITTAQIQDASITSAKIQDASISTAKIADLSVDTIKIAGNAVTLPLAVSGGTVASIVADTGGANVLIFGQGKATVAGANGGNISLSITGYGVVATEGQEAVLTQSDPPTKVTPSSTLIHQQFVAAGSRTFTLTAQLDYGITVLSILVAKK